MSRRIGIVTSIVVLGALFGQAVPAAAAEVRISAAGDIARAAHTSTLPQQKTADLVTAFDPAAVLALGDLQYGRSGEPAGQYQDYIDFYDKSWGAFKSRTLPTIGDEEYETPDAGGYFRYWSEAGRPGSTPPGSYSVVLGEWLLLSVNTNCTIVDCTEQKRWMKTELAADTHACELAFYHHTGRKWPRTLMAKHRGEVVLAGHKHTYERWALEGGVRRFTVGTGGKSVGFPSAGAEAGARAFGVLNMTLGAAGYTWDFVSVEGQVLDSGTGACVA